MGPMFLQDLVCKGRDEEGMHTKIARAEYVLTISISRYRQPRAVYDLVGTAPPVG